MYTLFSMESESNESDELLIDKVIRKADQDKQGLRITADLIKQRQKLKVEIDKELNQPVEDNGESGGEGEDADDSSVSPNADAGTDETAEAKEAPKDEPPVDDKEDKKADKGEETDAVEASQSEGDLENMMGSGFNGDKAVSSKKEEPATEKEVSKESFNPHSLVIPVLFSGIREKHLAYTLSLEQYNLAPKSSDPKEQPVAYVKEEVIESLNKVVKLANTYLAKNTAVVENNRKALLSLNESLTVYSECHAAGKLHLTLKVVSNEDKLKALCAPGESDLKETCGVMLKYLSSTASLTAMVLENDLFSLGGSLSAAGYKDEGGVFTYHKVLPGFNQMSVACSEYRDYLTTKYQDYQAYRTQVYKVQELYDLSGVTLAEDKSLVAVLERLTGVITQLALMTDNLKDLSVKYTELIEQVKATCYDVEQDKVKQLASLDIDGRLKDFIRFKVASELYTTSMDVATGYVVSAIGAFSELIELND